MIKSFSHVCLYLLLAGVSVHVAAEGIPEPPVVFYGEVRNLVNGVDVRVTSGALAWTFYPSDAGPPVVVTTQLTNLNDQFSYALYLPCETTIAGLTATTNTFRLLSQPLTYTLNTVTINGGPVYLKVPSQNPFVMSSTNRGALQRVDLALQMSQVDTDGDGIPDAWEQMYGLNPLDARDGLLDTDHDGLNNFKEYVAGTNPTNAQSAFAFIRITPDVLGGIRVEWSSVSNRVYVLQRSDGPLSGFADIRMDIPSSPPVNLYRDVTATGFGPYFYRLRIQDAPMPLYDGDSNGLPDAWERMYFGQIRISAAADTDLDGMSNLAEYYAGTNPTNSSSALRLTRIQTASGGGFNLQWSSTINKSYTVLWSADPATGYDILASGIPATPPVNTFYDPKMYASGFYRVLVEP